MTHGDDRGKRQGPPPGGEAMQRRRAFLEQRGLPLDEKLEDEATPEEEEEEDQAEAEEEQEEDRTHDENGG